jgi:hypothetical protein
VSGGGTVVRSLHSGWRRPGRARAGGDGTRPVGGGRDARGGRAQTAERIAAGTEMIIARPGRDRAGRRRSGRLQPRLTRTFGEITTSVRGGPIAMNVGLLSAATSAYHNMKQLHNVR